MFVFLLTHLMRGATGWIMCFIMQSFISTHAPHARCDMIFSMSSPFSFHFYSRTSCEVRPPTALIRLSKLDFYSRTSCEVRLNLFPTWLRAYRFLLTHLMRGATLYYSLLGVFIVQFLLTHLMRGATIANPHINSACRISTHAPHARCDKSFEGDFKCNYHFYSRTSCEVRRLAICPINGTK